MTLRVCVLGIDGSGKSTVTAALPGVLAGEMNLTAASAGEAFRVVGPDEDHLAPKFHPDGLPFSGHLSIRLKRAAKRMVDNRRLYPAIKLAQMIFQDGATEKLIRRYSPPVMISDGNAFLSAVGRAANYLRSASDQAQATKAAPDVEDLKAVFTYIFDGQSLPRGSQNRLPRLWKGRLIYKLTRFFRLHAVWLPDVVVFLDLSPETAVKRIASRGQKVDRHENVADLAQAREMYLKALEAFRQYRSPDAVHRIPVDNLSQGETIGAIVEALRPRILARQARDIAHGAPLGTTRLTKGTIWGKAFNYRYLTRYLLAKWFDGAWREPTFFFSRLGRLFLKEGYSAGVMRVIYDRDVKKYGLSDRIFLGYPLHRAVYDRLQILVRKIEPELETHLRGGREVRIFTAPSGFAYDIFRPLERIAERIPGAMQRVRLVAADLDPNEVLEGELTRRAAALGIRFTFLRGDLTGLELRRRFEESAPYDMVLFVGLSSWLPKPQTLRHLHWVRKNLREEGHFITDSFTPEAYALSGRYVGYKAHYYTPEVYRALADYCGFDGLSAAVGSGRDGINHVLVASPRAPRSGDAVSYRPAECALASERL